MQLTSQLTLVCFVALSLRTVWEKAQRSFSEKQVQNTIKGKKARYIKKIANEARPHLVNNLGIYFPLSFF